MTHLAVTLRWIDRLPRAPAVHGAGEGPAAAGRLRQLGAHCYPDRGAPRA